MQSLDVVAIGAGSLALYPGPRTSGPAPWIDAGELWHLVGLDAAGLLDFVAEWGRGAGPWLARLDRDDGGVTWLGAPVVAADVLNRAHDLDHEVRVAIDALISTPPVLPESTALRACNAHTT